MKYILSVFLLLFFSLANAQLFGNLSDDRDGQTYKTVIFKLPTVAEVGIEREWMAENLNFKIDQSFCYKGIDAYCEKFGRVYNYDAALAACPDGWRVPTAKDWFQLFDLYGGIHNAGQSVYEGGKSKLNLQYGGFGEPGGYWHGVGKEGYYWDSEEKSAEQAGLIIIHEGTREIFHDRSAKYHLNAVRCIKETD